MTTPESAAARRLARQLLEREATATNEPADLAAAMQRAYTRISDNLRRSVGEDGYTALLTRALARTQSGDPVLRDIRRNQATGIHVDVAVDAHGPAAVRVALESLVAALVDILSDLIGEDMARSLLDHDAPRGATHETPR